MWNLALQAWGTLLCASRPRADLLLEILALRQQLEVYQRQVKRPRLRRTDRVFWITLRRHWDRWRSVLVIVKPETVLRWHREGYRRHWRRFSRGKPGRPPVSTEIVELIKRMSLENPSWGEDRIALEMKLKLGVVVSPSTVRRYRIVGEGPPSSTWRRFISSHAGQIHAMDFTRVVMWDYSIRHVLAIMAIDTRRIVHVAVTAHPTLEWLQRQIRQATPYGSVPRFLLHDNDGIFGQFATPQRPSRNDEEASTRRYRCALDRWLEQVMGIRGLPIPYGAPNASPHIERFFRELREECIRHFVFFSEGQLRRTVDEFVRYHNGARVHQGIGGIPAPQPGALAPIAPPSPGAPVRIDVRPVLGGLIHDYRRAA